MLLEILSTPFLIFKGKRLTDDLKEGSSAGCGFAMSDSGWSNSVLFQDYLKIHFLKYVPKQEGSKILILYDGSSTHFNAELIEWALTQNIVLFVIPPQSSHLLQPLDISCFSPRKKACNSLAHSYMKDNPGQIINRYAMTSLICKAYSSAMTPSNIKQSFEKTGIYPFNRGVTTPNISCRLIGKYYLCRHRIAVEFIKQPKIIIFIL